MNPPTLNLLEGADVRFRRENGLDIALVKNLPVALVFLPAADIPTFVGEGRVDLGVTGYDQVREHEAGARALDPKRRFSNAPFTSTEAQARSRGCEIVMDLGFGSCRSQVLVPERGGFQSPRDLIGRNIGTSFVHLAEQYFRNLELAEGNLDKGTEASHNGEVKTNIIELSGSVEAANALGVADGIVDLVGKFRLSRWLVLLTPYISDSGRFRRDDEGRWTKAHRYRTGVECYSHQVTFAWQSDVD